MKDESKKRNHKTPADLPGHIVVTDTLDLHGFFPEQIAEIIDTFIQNAVDLRLGKLRIIHGKGKSRLKYEVYQALRSNSHVTSFRDAPPDSGGWGVTVVELKPERN